MDVSFMKCCAAQWFQEYPEFLSNPFFISGESYAGIYVPTLSRNVAKGICSVWQQISFLNVTPWPCRWSGIVQTKLKFRESTLQIAHNYPFIKCHNSAGIQAGVKPVLNFKVRFCRFDFCDLVYFDSICANVENPTPFADMWLMCRGIWWVMVALMTSLMEMQLSHLSMAWASSPLTCIR